MRSVWEPAIHWLQENPARSVGTFERAAEEAVSLAGPHNFAGKTVMDTTNPIADTVPVGESCPSSPVPTNRPANGSSRRCRKPTWSKLSTAWARPKWSTLRIVASRAL